MPNKFQIISRKKLITITARWVHHGYKVNYMWYLFSCRKNVYLSNLFRVISIFFCWDRTNMVFETIKEIWSKLKMYDSINIYQNLHVSLSSLNGLWFLHKLQLHCAVHIPRLDLLHPQETLDRFSTSPMARQSLLYSYLCHLIKIRQKVYMIYMNQNP